MRLSDFLSMGGYAAYVWPAYGLALAALVALMAASVRRMRAADRALSRFDRKARP